MAERAWVPGDVAVARVRGEENVRIVRTGDSRNLWVSPERGVGVDSMRWHSERPDQIVDPRPLVVIDAEDREQVERLVRAMPVEWNLTQTDDPELTDDSIAGVPVALRNFIAPPRPPEPEHDGALVECDYDGKHGRAVKLGGCWTFYGDALRNHSAMYDDFELIRVLSHGVTPEATP